MNRTAIPPLREVPARRLHISLSHSEGARLVPAPTLSIVVPMYNEEDVIGLFFDRMKATLTLTGETWEILCVNDGSKDRTLDLLRAAHGADPRVKVVNLSRNFGKETALTAGLDLASGSAVIPIDADLQDPPELILPMIDKWREGYDVVLATRQDRATDQFLKRATARAFYSVMNRITRTRIPSNAGDFRLMDRRVVETLRHLRERNRFMKGLFAWVGFKTAEVPYVRPPRAGGATKFNYWRLWNFALDGITGYSTLPLRLAGYAGFLTAMTAIVYGGWLVGRTIIWGTDVPGYASTMVAVLFLGGVQLVVLGVIGEYLGRTFEESKHRPIYIVESTLGLADGAGPLIAD